MLFRGKGENMKARQKKRLVRFAAAALACALLGSVGCASNKAGIDSPQLPAKHWLDEAPGVPVSQKAKLEAAIPNLYDPAKTFSFEDCVFLTIQQSPLLVNSAVELEIQRLARTSAAWKYLPEPRMSVAVSNNLTRYNKNEPDKPKKYGQTQYDIGFSTAFPNPLRTYFEHSAQELMANLALSSHRKAVGQAIYKIATAYTELDARRRINAVMKALPDQSKSSLDYWQQVEAVDGRQGVQRNVAEQQLKEAELALEKGRMQETMLLTQLKILAGVDPRQRLSVDSGSVRPLIQRFDGRRLNWEDRWGQTEDQFLLRGQIKLADYNIMVAWAEYVPNMTLELNRTPSSGQYQPANGEMDSFLHLRFDFPLIDWGRRYRGVQTARMQKAQAFHKQANARTDYSNQWLQAEQQVSLAETNMRLVKVRFQTAEMRFREAEISFNEGLAPLPTVSGAHEAMINAQVALIEAEKELELAKLQWMFVSGMLQEYFLGQPAKEVE